ncbi:MAG: fructose-6-phosphate aldolase [Halobacteriovoraceae bacterium]|nr:fructose-6-phosphate aldolase [Halobacteriovoraceae bacterium]|tara:strand:+ start:17877 stop:18521 length:645 start_codon:yes stop_codon:yes gene_type:complete
MEFFIDTGDIEEIKESYSWGVIDGVTTNPSLVAKTGVDQKTLIKNIAEIVDGPISAEVISTDSEGMLKEAYDLAKIHDNVVIKLPMTIEGMKACHRLSADKIKTNVTLIFSANQALLAAKNGATYVSPFIGRLDDIGQTGNYLIQEIRTVFDNYGMETKILAASIRHTDHVKASALMGSDVATIPFKVLKQLFHHPLTVSGLEQFLADHAKSQK